MSREAMKRAFITGWMRFDTSQEVDIPRAEQEFSAWYDEQVQHLINEPFPVNVHTSIQRSMDTRRMSTYIADYPTKKAFKAACKEQWPAFIFLRDPSIQPGARSGSIEQLFNWNIRHMTVTNERRSWFAELTMGRGGKAIVK